jgi:hypothetical protein
MEVARGFHGWGLKRVNSWRLDRLVSLSVALSQGLGGTGKSKSKVPNLRLSVHSHPAWRKLKLPGDSSLMTYRGHGVLHTLIRCRFSPTHSTGQQFIYSGCSTGKVVGKDYIRTEALGGAGVFLWHSTCNHNDHLFFFLAVLGLELRAYTLSHSTSPLSWRVFSR